MPRVLRVFMVALSVGALAMGSAAVAGTKHLGEHAMSGTVTDIDPQSGKLSLNTGVGELELHFPPQSLKDVKEGDELTVHLGFSKGAAASGTQQKKTR